MMGELTTNASLDELTFEQALEQLDRLVRRMESGELGLDESIAAYRRGAELARFCQGKLEVAEQAIRQLDEDVLVGFAPAQAQGRAS